MGFQYASSYRFVLAFVQISLQKQSMEFLKTKIRVKVKFAYFIKLKKWIQDTLQNEYEHNTCNLLASELL